MTGLPEREAAAMLRECRAELAARGSTVIAEATGGAEIADWRHYPAGEVYDPRTHAQVFYHRHAPENGAIADAGGEHGHFHLFLRGEGMPRGVSPVVPPDLAVATAAARPTAQPQSAPLRRGAGEDVCHLVAIAVDGGGAPIRLFTTNRWVTGESWYRADDVISALPRFRLAEEGPAALLSRWLAALVALYRPEIAELLRRRDRAVIERRWRSRGNAFEDRRLEIASSLEIDLGARLADLEVMPRPLPAARNRLPRMAEGWGV